MCRMTAVFASSRPSGQEQHTQPFARESFKITGGNVSVALLESCSRGRLCHWPSVAKDGSRLYLLEAMLHILLADSAHTQNSRKPSLTLQDTRLHRPLSAASLRRGHPLYTHFAIAESPKINACAISNELYSPSAPSPLRIERKRSPAVSFRPR